ncbi:hypothetical protein BC938DRAFT_479657 [Jimgerdemannia flammicorona]|uniref:Uncharacterized protein n=1 Tax=Jimgerdemannia flammicorona TaxID=994334 RepID=A0A433QXY0_9FUNG|nr:hypothetical protein BC938DRAFT_479657 [Jimgerdemannia flammicorona]
MKHLAAELLLEIFAHVRDEPDTSPFPHLGLLSCSLVCRFWYNCAYPLLVGANDKHLSHDMEKYTNADLELLVGLMTESRRYGLNHNELIQTVEIVIQRLFVSRFRTARLDQPRVDAIGRLLGILPLQTKALKLNLSGISTRTELKPLSDFVSRLSPTLANTATLHLSNFNYVEQRSLFRTRSIKALTPSSSKASLHPICTLINHIRLHLRHIHLTSSDLHLTVLQSLRACLHITTALFHSPVSTAHPNDLATTIASWPKLRQLSIRDQDSDDCIALGPTIARLAVTPPPLLEVLELDNTYCTEAAPIYPSLRILLLGCSSTLVSLMLPTNAGDTTESADEFLAFLAELDMPRLEILDLSPVGVAMTGRRRVSAQQRQAPGSASAPSSLYPRRQARELLSAAPSLSDQSDSELETDSIPWPRLRRLELVSCHRVVPAFVRAVVESCPELETLRVGIAHEYLEEIETIMDGFVRDEGNLERGCGRARCPQCRVVIFTASKS